jgi:hypothetical protein
MCRQPAAFSGLIFGYFSANLFIGRGASLPVSSFGSLFNRRSAAVGGKFNFICSPYINKPLPYRDGLCLHC